MRSLGAVAVALTVGLTGCASAVNYSDPQGPLHAGGRGLHDADPAIRIVTFNIAYGRRIDRAIQCFGKPPLKGADIVLLQEMHAPGAEKIARALDMHFAYYPSSVRPGERDMGTGVLSPWPIEATEKLILPHTTRVMHRSRTAAMAVVRIEGVAVRVYSLHLGSPFGLSGGQRGDQAEAVLAHARGWAGPVIIGGDLNSKSIGKRFEAAGYRWLTKDVGRTVGPFSFDHVYVRGLAAPSRAGADRTCRDASDHSPVWALLDRID
jgi:endonuclease/exonuclease/phosphatase family metal-dependent hydrolase